jgi:hypothetical protein
VRVVGVRHIEVARSIHREGNETEDLAEGRAIGGDHGPVRLGVPLLDPALAQIVGIAFGDIEVPLRIYRDGRGSAVGAVNL